MLFRSQTKPLSIKELQQIFNEVLSSYRTCSETTKFVLGSMALSARDMSATDGKSKGLFDDDKNMSDDNMMLMLKNLVHKHRSYFAGSSNTFLTDNSELVIRPPEKKLRMGYKKRLRNKAEHYKKKARLSQFATLATPISQPILNKKMASCGFCGSVNKGENINTCPKRNRYSTDNEEFVLGKGGDNLKLLKLSIENQTCFSDNNQLPASIIEKGVPKKGYHYIINRVWRKMSDNSNSEISFQNLLIDISYINQFGDVEKKTDVYSGNLLYSLFASLDLQKTRQTFVYKKKELSRSISISQQMHSSETFGNINSLYGASLSQNSYFRSRHSQSPQKTLMSFPDGSDIFYCDI